MIDRPSAESILDIWMHAPPMQGCATSLSVLYAEDTIFSTMGRPNRHARGVVACLRHTTSHTEADNIIVSKFQDSTAAEGRTIFMNKLEERENVRVLFN